MEDKRRPSDADALDEARVIGHGYYDWSEDEPTTAVSETVARVVDRDPTDLDPLHRRIDADALDALVDADGTDWERPDVYVQFAYEGVSVTVTDIGEVVVRSNGSDPVASRDVDR